MPGYISTQLLNLRNFLLRKQVCDRATKLPILRLAIRTVEGGLVLKNLLASGFFIHRLIPGDMGDARWKEGKRRRQA